MPLRQLQSYTQAMVDARVKKAGAEADRDALDAAAKHERMEKAEREARLAAFEMATPAVQAAAAEFSVVAWPQLQDGDVPTPLMRWPLMAAFHAELLAKPPLKTDPSVATVGSFLRCMEELNRVLCRVCGGVGHTKEWCTTWGRMQPAVAADALVSKVLHKAASRPVQDIRANVAKPEKLGLLARLKYKLPDGYKGRKRGRHDRD